MVILSCLARESNHLDVTTHLHYVCLLHLVTRSIPLNTCSLQNNLPTHPFPRSAYMHPVFSPPQISRPFGKQEAAFCVQPYVVLCQPFLIGPGKAGNYSGLVRDVSGLSLAFQRHRFSEAPHFEHSLLKTWLLHAAFKSVLHLLIGLIKVQSDANVLCVQC